MPRLSRLALALATALALTCGAAASPAAAGVYTVHQCDYASGSGQHDFVWQSAGAPTVEQYGAGCNEFGLAVRNGGVGTSRTYPSGAYGGWFAYAPLGTVFTGFSGAFGALEGCCVSGMTSYGDATERPDGQGARAYLFQGHLGNDSWYAPSGLRGPVGRSWSSSASGFEARRVGLQLRCGPGFSCSQGPYGDLRLRGRSFDFTLRDDGTPSVGEPSGSLLAGGWLRGTRTLFFRADDSGGGLTRIEAAFDDGTLLASPSSCAVVAGRYSRLQPCPLGRSDEWALDTARLPDGVRGVELRATDVGGTTTRRALTIGVDNHAPASPRDVAPSGGDGWRSSNAFELRWTNPGGQHASIVRARWRACLAGAHWEDSGCVTGERIAGGIVDSGPIALPAAGEWDVRLWLEDAAGNSDAETASPAQRLRYDPDPPALRFLPADPTTPARFDVVGHDLSGVVAGTIELRPYGAESWIALPTERAGGRLTAVLDERRRGGGAYDLRVRAVDAAGNEGIDYGGTRTIPEHAPAVPAEQVKLPAARVTMAARAPVARRHGKRRPPTRWGRALRRIAVTGGRPVLFQGRVGRPVPRHGKLVEVQAHFRGRWRTISAVRSRRDGRWRFRYSFRTTGRPAAYRMRARLPVEAGYPFAAGASRPVRVTVLPNRR
ncbi:MAG TPA: hypothetical protein VFQ14_03405 [Thermoleophilaceae bacterium]|nr:hypothetical protein [Thermoleophilaceae bacterium]